MESLGVDVKLLIAQLINFVLFLVIFKKFIAKPFSDFLNLEVKKEKEKERVLADLAKKQEQAQKDAQKLSEKMKKDYDRALSDAKKEAAIVKDQLIVVAKKDASEIIEKARRQIDDERSQMNTEMKAKTVDLSITIVRRVLEKFLSQDAQKQVTEEVLRNYKEEKIS